MSSNPDSTVGIRYRGEVVYLFAYDVAYEMGRAPIKELLGQPMTRYNVDASKRNPRHLFFQRPQMVSLPAEERVGPHGAVRVEREIKVLPIGAISIRVRVPFAVQEIEELSQYHDLRFETSTLHDEVRALVSRIQKDLEPYIVRPIPEVAEEEAYTVFCFQGPIAGAGQGTCRGEAWLELHRREVAALLTQAPNLSALSRQESMESTSKSLSYFEDDLVVIDWDAALLIDERKEWEETLYVLELANLQLSELEAYDRALDVTLERSYRDLRARSLRGRGTLLQDLRELRIDMARFNDELSNITKFFGDWYMARVYETVAARFHLAEWNRTVVEKLRTVGDLHELLKHDQSNRWMMILEVTIVLLFVVDVGFLVAGIKR